MALTHNSGILKCSIVIVAYKIIGTGKGSGG
jgi:hypothetical protein